MGPRRIVCVVAVLIGAGCVPVAAVAAGGTSYTWVGNTNSASADNHSWSDQNNWQPVGVPGDGDSVVIEQPSSTECFAHVDGVPTVALVNFSLVENPALCTTSVSGGAISVAGSFMWNGGDLDTPTALGSTSTATVSGSNQRLNSLTQDLDVAGTLTLSGTTGSGALQILHGVDVHIEPGASLISGGTNEIDGSACCTDPAKVVNDGTISVNGDLLTIATAELDQHAAVATSLGGRLLSTAAPVTASGGTYTGNGSWAIESGVAARFSGTQHLGHDFHLEFGGLSATSSSTLAGNTTLGGTGTFDWTGGVIDANLTIAHGVSVQVVGAHTGGARRVLQGRDFSGGGGGVPVTQTNHGTITVGGAATITTAAQVRLTNAADGVIGLAPGTSLSSQACCSAPDRLTNAGTVSVPASPTGSAVVDGVSYESIGTTTIASGRTLQVTGGAPDSLKAGKITGGGHLQVTSPTAVHGAVVVDAHTRLLLGTHGSLDGTANLTGAGGLTWTGGSFSGNVTVAAAAGVAISGADTKVIANVGGGSTPSTVRLSVPTSIAAGTRHAHDVVDLGDSTLVLAATTTAGAFTEFSGGGGTLVNRATLMLHNTTSFASAYTQDPTGTLAVDLTPSGHGDLQVRESATVGGTVLARNSYRPAFGARVTVVATHTLTTAPSCVRTAGTASTGARAGHWAPVTTATGLALVWRRGAHTHC